MGLVTDAVGGLLCLITLMAQLVAEGLVLVVNLVISSLGAVLAVVIANMPPMPDWPVTGLDMTWLNWFLPVSGLVTLFGTAVTLCVTWLGYRIVMNWVRAL